MSEEITIQEFIEKEQEILKDFMKYWKLKSKTEQKSFPKKLSYSEFEAFVMTALTLAAEEARKKTVLDVACGSRMFWFNRADERAVFLDKRKLKIKLKDKSSRGGQRSLVIQPDIQCDFTNLPFEDEFFPLVVFDPPHLIRNGKSGWLAKKYGKLEIGWREELRKGFAECFRVLKNQGTLIFKWNERDVPVREILTLTTERPLFGNRCGKRAQSHWIVFQKTLTAGFTSGGF